MSVREATGRVLIRVEEFVVYSPISDEDELGEVLEVVASDIASDIGVRLASLGLSVSHGNVRVEMDGQEGNA